MFATRLGHIESGLMQHERQAVLTCSNSNASADLQFIGLVGMDFMETREVQ